MLCCDRPHRRLDRRHHHHDRDRVAARAVLVEQPERRDRLRPAPYPTRRPRRRADRTGGPAVRPPRRSAGCPGRRRRGCRNPRSRRAGPVGAQDALAVARALVLQKLADRAIRVVSGYGDTFVTQGLQQPPRESGLSGPTLLTTNEDHPLVMPRLPAPSRGSSAGGIPRTPRPRRPRPAPFPGPPRASRRLFRRRAAPRRRFPSARPARRFSPAGRHRIRAGHRAASVALPAGSAAGPGAAAIKLCPSTSVAWRLSASGAVISSALPRPRRAGSPRPARVRCA